MIGREGSPGSTSSLKDANQSLPLSRALAGAAPLSVSSSLPFFLTLFPPPARATAHRRSWRTCGRGPCRCRCRLPGHRSPTARTSLGTTARAIPALFSLGASTSSTAWPFTRAPAALTTAGSLRRAPRPDPLRSERTRTRRFSWRHPPLLSLQRRRRAPIAATSDKLILNNFFAKISGL